MLEFTWSDFAVSRQSANSMQFTWMLRMSECMQTDLGLRRKHAYDIVAAMPPELQEKIFLSLSAAELLPPPPPDELLLQRAMMSAQRVPSFPFGAGSSQRSSFSRMSPPPPEADFSPTEYAKAWTLLTGGAFAPPASLSE